jgi:hypothetical protein
LVEYRFRNGRNNSTRYRKQPIPVVHPGQA